MLASGQCLTGNTGPACGLPWLSHHWRSVGRSSSGISSACKGASSPTARSPRRTTPRQCAASRAHVGRRLRATALSRVPSATMRRNVSPSTSVVTRAHHPLGGRRISPGFRGRGHVSSPPRLARLPQRRQRASSTRRHRDAERISHQRNPLPHDHRLAHPRLLSAQLQQLVITIGLAKAHSFGHAQRTASYSFIHYSHLTAHRTAREHHVLLMGTVLLGDNNVVVQLARLAPLACCSARSTCSPQPIGCLPDGIYRTTPAPSAP